MTTFPTDETRRRDRERYDRNPMKPYRERMGRLNPNDPHAFVDQPVDTDAYGGSGGSSRLCGVCRASKDDPRHFRPQGPLREQHGPFGE